MSEVGHWEWRVEWFSPDTNWQPWGMSRHRGLAHSEVDDEVKSARWGLVPTVEIRVSKRFVNAWTVVSTSPSYAKVGQ